MEVAIDFEYLKGSQDEFIIKEILIAGKNTLHTLHFPSTYDMNPHGYAETDSIRMTAMFLTGS